VRPCSLTHPTHAKGQGANMNNLADYLASTCRNPSKILLRDSKGLAERDLCVGEREREREREREIFAEK